MPGKFADVIRIGVAIILGGIGAAAGFTHTHEWAISNGQDGWLAWATAVVIEGMAVFAGIEIHHARATHQPCKFAVTVLVFGILVQMTAQVSEATPTPFGWLVAAMPALGFLAVVKLLMRRLPTTTPDTPTGDAPALTVQHGPAPDRSSTPASAPAPAPRVKLPAGIQRRITDAMTAARTEGREPSIEDIQRVAKIPADLAGRILANQPVNGYQH
jgi:uncharacterized protein DUF2637